MMRKQAVSFMYSFSIIMQSLFSVVFTTAVFVGIGYVLTTYLSVGQWVYIPLILGGLGIGVFSMVRFVISAMNGLMRIEKEWEDKEG